MSIEALRNELDEQCRLLGMSGEREAKLLAELETVKRERDALLESCEAKDSNYVWLEGLYAACQKERNAFQDQCISLKMKRTVELEQRDELSRSACQLEPVSNSYKLGTCIKCGNPSQDITKEHFVVATASEGARTPEGSNPQRVEAPQDMAGRIADILIEDHIALMNELEAVKKERDDRASHGMVLTLKATIRDLTDQLTACQQQRDELAEALNTILGISLMDKGHWAKTIEAEAVAAIAKLGADKEAT